ncbi:Transcriptional regulator, LysR family OS=Tsukamurella paurometabola (strain ATCC 8368 / DSM/ CCUG 35730 / CIP 100753 / JCM 10117 / KCTC 9821 / NBRC 16120/ NCIMB 702349 / NCTC 13040) OX=521096 GN=Tpau_0382 PE=3 SV=1 [Tsukamurella paurometabola]|uniref:Transcriptional regulator, LysR family n=1 Tax=Tsukamurella paurometabola (strain ATCC 8368 / DSM 20162 / CCUG 35730 / CIP 100753 / JCM 10117 / KCTC 9821 / NBRC 16120 / NCIMB 702349 / NCTC 13040) TaxID=521096 RepID=D5URH1_TSUPD|nr:LysR family transcriptional regulator [Tsukamurella paurometabola]ADG77024.1 transcriptional regulator, LysR family [Tsukamurella paurometabola DSM 20162]SUP42496.1 Morphology and auto-aggregation control protein [Tsukamurella paurometabola]
MADYTLRQLEYFVAVAEANSITRAAAAVHLSQSAMSTALADLEGALGVQLVVRHHAKGITLTPAGRELVVASRQLLASAADLRSAAQGLGSSLSGTLSVGCFQVVAPYVLPTLLSVASQKLPRLELRTTEVDLADLAEGVADGTFELGIGYDLVDDPRLKRWPLRTISPHVLVSGSHPLAQNASVHLSELADEPMALLDLPHSRDYFRRIFAAAGVEPNVRYRSTTVETCRALVGRGLAYTVLNFQSAVPMALDGHPVASVPIADASPALTMVLLNAVAAKPTRRATVVAELCRDLFGSEGA